MVVAFAFLAAACETAGESDSRARSTPPSSSQLRIGDSESFTPATHKERGKVVMPVTFPDGSTAEIVYPPDTDIAAMGAQPYSSGQLSDCCARDFFVLYGGVPKSELAGEARSRSTAVSTALRSSTGVAVRRATTSCPTAG
jgi:hypothetical protein